MATNIMESPAAVAAGRNELISVVISTYKGGELLQRAIESLASQSDQGFETIVVNDCSPCEITNAVCKRFEQEGSVRVLWRKKNGGLSAGRNTGIQASKGDILVMLDEDDVLPKTAIADIRKAFEENPQADFIFGNYIKVNVDTCKRQIIDTSVLCDEDGWLNPKYLVENWIFLGHSPCRKRVWKGVGGYLQRYSYDFQDVDFWLRVLDKGFTGVHVPFLIYQWNQASSGMCSRNIPRMRYFISRHIRYYEDLCGQENEWYKLIDYYLSNRNDPVIRAEAREVWNSLIPRRTNRILLFIKFSVIMALPMALDKLLIGRPNSQGS